MTKVPKAIVIYDSTEKNIIRRVFIVPKGMSYIEAVEQATTILKRAGVDSVDALDKVEFDGFFEEAGFVGINLADIKD